MLHKQIQNEIPDAMRAKDEIRLSVLRGMKTAFVNELVARGRKPTEEISDEDALGVIRRLAKQRRESAEQFEKGGRADLAEREKRELSLLESYLPQMMDQEKIREIATAKKDELGVTDKSKAGMLMAALMKELAGKADGKDVKEVVDGLF